MTNQQLLAPNSRVSSATDTIQSAATVYRPRTAESVGAFRVCIRSQVGWTTTDMESVADGAGSLDTRIVKDCHLAARM